MNLALMKYTDRGAAVADQLREHAERADDGTKALCVEAADVLDRLVERMKRFEAWTNPDLFMDFAKKYPLENKWSETNENVFVNLKVVSMYLITAESATAKYKHGPSIWKRVRNALSAACSAWSKAE